MPFKKVETQMNFPKMEEGILEFWDAEKIFEKSIKNREGKPMYSFNDGPPFATGTPHYGHIVASAIKDTVPRYFTMKGFQVERKWGWDCHGLPIENIAEKELGITHKKEIESLGVEKFNEMCRSKVLEYVADWKKVIRRFGRWADMDNAYKTMDRDYMESVWWVFKSLWDKGLIYENYRTMHICPRCETTLSQSEVAEGYKEVKDLSVIAKFELIDERGTFVLAWTTTPWTLPGNVALAVGKDIEYVKIRYNNENGDARWFILSKSMYERDKKGLFPLNKELRESETPPAPPAIVEEFKGEKLVGESYKPPFDYYSKDEKLENRDNGWKIYAGDFVTTEDGTGVVHIAPGFGEDDMELGKKEHLPFVQHVNLDGTMKPEVTDFAGSQVKPKENPQAMDIEIIRYLAHKGLLFAKEKYEHSYPHCWRCDTPLLNYATSSWFVAVTKIKDQALELAKEINWSPSHIKEGRFGKWLAGARDWSISRQRYWASVMPIWKCDCGEMLVFGSIAELEGASGQKITDLHKHVVDKVTLPCAKCGETMKRIPDVLDTWFDSGSMPYAQMHYPFENKEEFEERFPADFIAEGIDQTRAWFYYQHILGVALKENTAFKNVIVNGIIVGDDGKKLSKKLKNYADPMEVIEKYGADALRFYLLSSPVVAAENLTFSDRELSDISRNTFRMLWNSYSFFTTYAMIDGWEPARNATHSVAGGPKKAAQVSGNILDRWILSELQLLIREVDGAMGRYELSKATRAFAPFVDHLSNWYIRRSRKRFWKSENDADKEQAYQTLYEVLVTLAKAIAPFTPFLSEEIYKNLTGATSVHLADWPDADEKQIDEKLNRNMEAVREIVTVGLQKRAEAKIKVRQPLNMVSLGLKYEELFNSLAGLQEDYYGILQEELNVKKVGINLLQKAINPDADDQVILDTNITPELRLEGEAREIIRAIQEGRKKAKFNVEDRIVLSYRGKEEVFEKKELNEMIRKEILAISIELGEMPEPEYMETVELEGEAFSFSLKRA